MQDWSNAIPGYRDEKSTNNRKKLFLQKPDWKSEWSGIAYLKLWGGIIGVIGQIV